jgi:probable phosphomutase (TIGR03848 family)
MSMAILILIRHGETDYVGHRLAGHLPGIHLNQNGNNQARALAKRLSALPVNAIFSSPLERTMETARPLAKMKGLPVLSLPALTEINVGDWQGKSIPALRRLELWRGTHEEPARFSFPNGESFADKQRTIVTALEKLIRDRKSDSVLACVSHGDPIKLSLAYFLGLDLNNFQRIAIDPASASFIYFSGSRVRLGPINLVEDIPLIRPKR